jgi:DNA-directed RNA polymerase specialized sigma24 family protein
MTQITQLLERMHGGDAAARDALFAAAYEELRRLAQADARLAQMVEMRYFGGYSDGEIAETLGVTERTVRRDWAKAGAILADALS